jgi:hypothetical protein
MVHIRARMLVSVILTVSSVLYRQPAAAEAQSTFRTRSDNRTA